MLAVATAQEGLNDCGVFANVLRPRAMPQHFGQTHSTGSQRTKALLLRTRLLATFTLNLGFGTDPSAIIGPLEP